MPERAGRFDSPQLHNTFPQVRATIGGFGSAYFYRISTAAPAPSA